MSKAFTKEDDGPPPPPPKRRGVPVPELNFVTAAGLAAAREELGRPGIEPDRAAELAAHLATAQVHVPTDRGEAGLGATVVVETTAGKRLTYRIVGAIEADAKHGAVSWQTPLAEALDGLRTGDSTTLPNGEDVEIVAITY
ncbi:MAG: GreA/GreB family elongation factor [Kofleriaceae bacterium]